ncbi:hypothetical protein [Methylobacterium radiotolerans]
MSYKALSLSVVAAFWVSGSTSSHALDQCSDILKDGVYQKFSDKSNYYLTLIRDLKFSQMDFRQSKEDMSFGANVAIGKLVLGGNYTEDEFNQRKSEIRQAFNVQLSSSKLLDLSLTSGDPGVIGAWTQCMSQSGGLALTYEIDNSTSVRAVLEWYPPPKSGQGSVTLSEDVSLPTLVDVEHSSVSCFKKGRELTARAPCTAVLRLKDPSSTATLVAYAEHAGTAVSNAVAYLGPRLKPIEEIKPFDFDTSPDCKKFRMSEVAAKENQISLYLSCGIGSLLNEGWTFDVGSLKIIGTEVSSPGHGSNCRFTKEQETPFGLGYTNRADSRVGGTQICRADATVNIKRQRWVPY